MYFIVISFLLNKNNDINEFTTYVELFNQNVTAYSVTYNLKDNLSKYRYVVAIIYYNSQSSNSYITVQSMINKTVTTTTAGGNYVYLMYRTDTTIAMNWSGTATGVVVLNGTNNL